MYDVVEINSTDVTVLSKQELDGFKSQQLRVAGLDMTLEEAKSMAIDLAGEYVAESPIYGVIDEEGVIWYQVYMEDGMLFCHRP